MHGGGRRKKEEGGRRASSGGWGETIDLIMHACSLIQCNGGKGREAEWEGGKEEGTWGAHP